MREAYRATANHNTLTMDGETIDDTHQKGELLTLYTTDDDKTDILVTQNESYEGVFHRRAVLHVDRKFFVVVDEAFSPYEPTEVLPVELNFHLLTDAKNPTKVIMPETDGTDAVKAYTCFTDGNNIYTATFIEKIDEINLGDINVSKTESDFSTEYNKVNGKRSGYKVSVLKRGKKLRFITVIYPCSNGENVANVNAEFIIPVLLKPLLN